MFIDSHCHMDHVVAWGKKKDGKDFSLAAIVDRAEKAKVYGMLSICTKMEEFEEIHEISQKFPHIYCTIGLHPMDVLSQGCSVEDVKKWLLANIHHEKVVGIGETGLESSEHAPPLDVQEAYLWAHMEVALISGLPLVIHTRNTCYYLQNVLEKFLNQYSELPTGVLHCFSGEEFLARYVVEHGWKVSFSGILTFPKAVSVRQVAATLSLKDLLIETDAPWLAPCPHRGAVNEPAYVVHTAQKLAEIHNVSLAELAHQTSSSFCALFSKVNPQNFQESLCITVQK